MEFGFVSTIAIDPLNPSTVFAGTYVGGIFKSLNGGGESWSATSEELIPDDIHKIAIDPQHPSVIYATTIQGS